MWELDYKKAEHQRIDAFELWCWRSLLRVPWTARRANQSILKEISPENSLEGLMQKLKRQYFDHLMQRTNSFEKTLMLGKIEGRGRRGRHRRRWLDGITDSMDMSLSKLREFGDRQGSLVCCSPWGHKESDMTKTELNWVSLYFVAGREVCPGASTPALQQRAPGPSLSLFNFRQIIFPQAYFQYLWVLEMDWIDRSW